MAVVCSGLGLPLLSADKFVIAYERARISWGPLNVKDVEEALKVRRAIQD